NKITYGEPVSVQTLGKYLANHKHIATQYAGLRPFGVGLLIGGPSDQQTHSERP
ncbi:MAG: proteasome subunit alpha, partial [Candidatus Aenigmarchaeota archaeon]|nr:proteasome subunit alpha [Candidatus Aenigmarchaeota archaeon]